MKSKTLSLIGLALTVGLLPVLGCASIVKGSNQKVYFGSEPEGAKVTVYDEGGSVVAEGTSPVTLPLKRGAGYFSSAKYKVVFEAQGYDKKEVWLSGSLEAGWYLAGNLLLGGWIGWLIVDPLTGAMWRLAPENVSANLERSLAAGSAEGLHIVLAEQIPSDVLARAEPLQQRF